MKKELRKYQVEAVSESLSELQRHGSTAAVLATGTGKGSIIATVAAAAIKERGKPVLVLAHRGELLTQVYNNLQSFTDIPPMDIGFEIADSEISPLQIPPIVLASVQSLRGKRLEKFPHDAFGLVIRDELHHSSARVERNIYEYFSTAWRYGVTATPDRSVYTTREKLTAKQEAKRWEALEMFCPGRRPAYTYEIMTGIEEGYLVPIRCVTVNASALDLSKVEIVAGDFNERQLEQVAGTDEVINQVAPSIIVNAGTKKSLVFCLSIKHSYDMAAAIERFGGRATAISGRDDARERSGKLAAFQSGDIQYLCCCDLLTEGVDIPITSVVAMCRPTLSRNLMSQAIGRGTRLHPESGKTECLVLDFVGNSGRHKLVTPQHILSTAAIDDEVLELALQYGNEGDDMITARKKAEHEVGRRRKMRVLQTGKFVTEVPAFILFGIAPPAGRFSGAPVTPGQREALTNFKFTEQEIAQLDKGQAIELLSVLIDRARSGKCSYRQAKFLAKRKMDNDISFEEAHEIMNEISIREGWGNRQYKATK